MSKSWMRTKNCKLFLIKVEICEKEKVKKGETFML